MGIRKLTAISTSSGRYGVPYIVAYLSADGKRLDIDPAPGLLEIRVITFYRPQSLSLRDTHYLFEYALIPDKVVHTALISRKNVSRELKEVLGCHH